MSKKVITNKVSIVISFDQPKVPLFFQILYLLVRKIEIFGEKSYKAATVIKAAYAVFNTNWLMFSTIY